MQGTIVAVCQSEAQGTVKQAVVQAELRRGHGIVGDAHAGTWHRQLSLLASEHIAEMRARGLTLEHGAFGENLVTQGLETEALEVGRRLHVGDRAIVQLTQRGKECHTRCAIYHQTGDCIMPTKGWFARVLRTGLIRAGDAIRTDPSLDHYRYGVITLSDRSSAKERDDSSGPLVAELVGQAIGGECLAQQILPDDRKRIELALIELCDETLCDLVVTTGGTGLSPRDVTPEATLAVIERSIPGLAEAMRAAGLRHTPFAMLSRAVCGQRGHSIIINLSGSPKAVREQLEVLLPALPHALRTATGIPQDCAR